MGKIVEILIENPFTVLLVIGFLLLFSSFILVITRNNYTRIVRMIDKGEEEAISKRIEEWGEMILNNVQQDCMERKLSLTFPVIMLPIISLLIIVFSVFQLNMVTNLILAVIHLIVLLVIYFILRLAFRKKSVKKPNKASEENKPV